MHWLAGFPWRGFTLLWGGHDPALFHAIWTSLQDAGILFERTRARGFEAAPPSDQLARFMPPLLRIRVRSEDANRAREILRRFLGGAPLA